MNSSGLYTISNNSINNINGIKRELTYSYKRILELNRFYHIFSAHCVWSYFKKSIIKNKLIPKLEHVYFMTLER